MPKKQENKKLLEIRNLSVHYNRKGRLFRALKNVDLDVYENEILGIVGESGSGKTTLGKAILNLTPKKTGYVKIDDKETPRKKLKIASKKHRWIYEQGQMIFQDPKTSLNQQKKVGRIIEEGFKNFKILDKEFNEKKDKLEQTLNNITKQIDVLKNNRKEVTKNLQEESEKKIRSKVLESLKDNKDFEYQSKKIQKFVKAFEDLDKVNSKIKDLKSTIKERKNLLLESQRNKRLDIQSKTLLDASETKYTFKEELKELKVNPDMLPEDSLSFKYFQKNYFDLIEERLNFQKEYINDIELAISEEVKKQEIVDKKDSSEITFLKNFYKNYSQFGKRETIKYCNLWNNIFLDSLKLKYKTLDNLIKKNYSNDYIYQILEAFKFLPFSSKNTKLNTKIKRFNLKFEKLLIDKFASLDIKRDNEILLVKNDEEEVKEIYKKFDEKKKILLNEQKSNSIIYANLVYKIRRNEALIALKKTLKKDINVLKNNKSILSRNKESEELKNIIDSFEKVEHFEKNIELISKYEKSIWRTLYKDRKEEINLQYNLAVEKTNYYKDFYKKLKILIKNHNATNIKEVYDFFLKANSDLGKINNSLNTFSLSKTIHYFLLENNMTLAQLKSKRKIYYELLTYSGKNTFYDQVQKARNIFGEHKLKLQPMINEITENNNKLLSKLSNSQITNEISLKKIEEFEVKKQKIIEDLELLKEKYSKKNRKTLIAERVAEILRLVGLSPEITNSYPSRFSGGQQQRMGIARTLIVKPKFFIADEPISALDVSVQAQVINLIKEIKEKFKLTVIFIAHDLQMVQYISDRIIVIYRGDIVESGSSKDVYQSPIHPYTKSLIAAMPDVNKYDEKLTLSTYNSSKHYYNEYKKILFKDIGNRHFVRGTEEEIESWLKSSKH